MKDIRVLVQAGGDVKDFVFPIVLSTPDSSTLATICKGQETEVVGKKVTIIVTADLTIKFKNPRAKRPYIVFIDSEKGIKKKVKMYEKINAHYEDWTGTHFLVVRRKDTDRKEFLLLIADDRYINTLITH